MEFALLLGQVFPHYLPQKAFIFLIDYLSVIVSSFYRR